MKKKLFLIIISILLLGLIIYGVFKIFFSNSIDKEILENRQKVINNIGVTNDSQVVVKFNNEEGEECYYIFYITERGYTQYLYIFHDNREIYDSYIDEYILEPKYSLKSYDDTLLTVIKLSDASNINGIDVKEFLLKEYSNKKFEIVD